VSLAACDALDADPEARKTLERGWRVNSRYVVMLNTNRLGRAPSSAAFSTDGMPSMPLSISTIETWLAQCRTSPRRSTGRGP
jgi:hypothetical protein